MNKRRRKFHAPEREQMTDISPHSKPSRIANIMCFSFTLIAFFTLLVPGLSFGTTVSVEARLQPKQFPLDQAATLLVTIKGSSQGQPEKPHGPGLRFTYQGQSTQMQWINGRSSSSVTYSFQVLASQEGRHRIDPVTIQIGKQTYQTKAITCTVLPPSSGGQGKSSGTTPAPQSSSTRLRSGEADKIGFMRLIPEKKSLYAGELMPFTIKAFFRQGIRATLKSNPRIQDNNFILNGIEGKPRQSEEQIKGIPYTVLTWKGTVSGVKQGVFPLEVEMDVSLLVRSQRQRPSSMFGSPLLNDPFFDDFFSGFRRKDITLVSPRISLKVQDLPTKGRPEDFSGAVGIFSLAVQAQPTTIKSGDPITLKMRIQGRGNFDRVHAPHFPENKNWKSYKPSSKPAETKQGRGQKEFEQAIIPLSPQIDAIPALAFSYFDPQAGQYVRVNSDPISINIQGAAPSISSPKKSKGDTRTKQIAPTPPQNNPKAMPILNDFGKAVPALRPVYQALWFQIVLALSLIFLLTTVVFILHRQRRNRHPERARKKALRLELQQLLTQAREAQEAKDSATFFALCRRILQQRLAFSWQREAQSICTADLQRQLPAGSPLPEIFEKSEHAAYSGATISPEEMSEILSTLQQEIQQL